MGVIAAIAMFGTMALGTMFGVITPLLLEKIGRRPRGRHEPVRHDHERRDRLVADHPRDDLGALTCPPANDRPMWPPPSS